jgi:hypothetical protein
VLTGVEIWGPEDGRKEARRVIYEGTGKDKQESNEMLVNTVAKRWDKSVRDYREEGETPASTDWALHIVVRCFIVVTVYTVPGTDIPYVFTFTTYVGLMGPSGQRRESSRKRNRWLWNLMYLRMATPGRNM